MAETQAGYGAPVFPFHRLPLTTVDSIFLAAVHPPHGEGGARRRRALPLTLIAREYVDSGRRALVYDLGVVVPRMAPALLGYLQAHPTLASHIRRLQLAIYKGDDPVGRGACMRIVAAGLRLDDFSVVATPYELRALLILLAEGAAGLRTTRISLDVIGMWRSSPLPASLLRSVVIALAPTLVAFHFRSAPEPLPLLGDIALLPALPRMRKIMVSNLEAEAPMVAALIRASAGPLVVSASGVERWIELLGPADLAKVCELTIVGSRGDDNVVSVGSWRRMTGLSRLRCTSDPFLEFADETVVALPPSISYLYIELIDIDYVNMTTLAADARWWSIPRLVGLLGDAQWLPALAVLEVNDGNRPRNRPDPALLKSICSQRGIDLRLSGRP